MAVKMERLCLSCLHDISYSTVCAENATKRQLTNFSVSNVTTEGEETSLSFVYPMFSAGNPWHTRAGSGVVRIDSLHFLA